MISNSMIIQILMVIVAGVIGWMYIIPTFDAIKETQKTTLTYHEEIEKVEDVNDILSASIAKIESMSLSDQDRLERFMPTEIDEVSVLRELQYLLEQFDVTITTLTYTGTGADASAQSSEEGAMPVVVSPVVKHGFEVGFTSSYDEMKAVLSKLERNDYLFEIVSATLTPGGGESDEDDEVSADNVATVLNISVNSLPIKTINSTPDEVPVEGDDMMSPDGL